MSKKTATKKPSVLAEAQMSPEALPGVPAGRRFKAVSPALAWVTSKPWDGQERTWALMETLEHKTPQAYVYVMEWMTDALRAAMGLDNDATVLVLSGRQGIGKSLWVRSLCPHHGLVQEVGDEVFGWRSLPPRHAGDVVATNLVQVKGVGYYGIQLLDMNPRHGVDMQQVWAQLYARITNGGSQ